MNRLLALTFVAALVVAACGDDSDDGGSAGAPSSGGSAGASVGGSGGSAGTAQGGASGTAGSAQGGAAGAGQCTTLQNLGQYVPESAGVGDFPTPQGGAIPEGTFVLTKYEIYPPGSVDPYQRKSTLKITGSSVEMVEQKDNEPEQRSAGTFEVTGTAQGTLHVVCPSTADMPTSFTATATEFKLFVIKPGENEVHTFVKQ